MKIGIVAGSQRQDSQTTKAANYIQTMLEEKLDTETYLLDLSTHPLPLYKDENVDAEDAWDDISAQLRECDGFVIMTPEWNGMATAAVKNFFLYASYKELGHKPGLLVTVSAGRGGAYPIAELRSSSYKNCRINYIPEHLIIRDVDNVLNPSEEDNDKDSDEYYRERIFYSLKLLIEYTKALKQVRYAGEIDYDKYRNGM